MGHIMSSDADDSQSQRLDSTDRLFQEISQVPKRSVVKNLERESRPGLIGANSAGH